MKILNVYLFLPFIFSFLFASFAFIKNPLHLRRIAKTLFSALFVFSFFVFAGVKEYSFSLLGIDFSYNSFSALILLFLSFIFLLFSIISKTTIIKLHRLFYSSLMLLFALSNLVILSDNIFIIFCAVFWVLLLGYLLTVAFSSHDNRKDIKIQFVFDVFLLLFSCFLIAKDFLRYFILNDIPFTFSQVALNLNHVDDRASTFAFIGFLILIFRFFNFFPFSSKNLALSNKINPLVNAVKTSLLMIFAFYLMKKCYFIFDYIFYQKQVIISFYVLFNFAYFVILSLRQDSLFKFLFSLTSALCAFGVFSLLSFLEGNLEAFLYYSFVLVISYLMASFAFLLLKEKFKTDNISFLKKIADSQKAAKFFVLISLLNLSHCPFLALFSGALICFMMIFLTETDVMFLNLAPYIFLCGFFVLNFSVYNIIYKILIEPYDKARENFSFSKHQILVFCALAFVLLVLGFYPSYIISGF